MAALTFELTTLPGTITADVNYYEDAGGGDYTPILTNPSPDQIHNDQPWRVRLEGLTQTGAIFGSYGGNNWRFRVYFEPFGSDTVVTPAPLQVVFPVNTTVPFTYPNQVINVPANHAPEGIYKLVAELKMIDANGKSPIAGAGELTPAGASGKVLQIINA